MNESDRQPTRPAIGKPIIVTWPLKLTGFRLWLAGVALLLLGNVAGDAAADWKPLARCKYSVRDVAFVNVHGKCWQLRLVKPQQVSDRQFQAWNRTLRSKLERSNVGYVWVKRARGDDGSFKQQDGERRLTTQQANRSSDVAAEPTRSGSDVATPKMMLLGPDGDMVTVPAGQTMASRLARILGAKATESILAEAVDSLCVYVLIRSGNQMADDRAKNLVEEAIDRVERQMWSYDKSTGKPPVLVQLDANSAHDEVLLRSLGVRVEPNNSPLASPRSAAVAVVFGQGRCLGEPLQGPQLTVDALVGRASICGRDCECELDRDWLYRRQIVHVWPKALELAAEACLDFDPHSAFVISEVAQILQKNQSRVDDPDRPRSVSQPGSSPDVALGGGLLVHELESLPELKPSEQPSERSSDSSQGDSGDLARTEPVDALVAGSATTEMLAPSHRLTPAPGQRKHVPQSGSDSSWRQQIPWAIFLVVTVVTIIGALIQRWFLSS